MKKLTLLLFLGLLLAGQSFAGDMKTDCGLVVTLLDKYTKHVASAPATTQAAEEITSEMRAITKANTVCRLDMAEAVNAGTDAEKAAAVRYEEAIRTRAKMALMVCNARQTELKAEQ